MSSGKSTSSEACAPLQSLHYSCGGETLGPDNFTLPELVDLLQPHKASLEELYLEAGQQTEFERPYECLPSLCDFTALKKLDTNMSCWADCLLLNLVTWPGPLDDDEESLDDDEEWSDPEEDNTTVLLHCLPPFLECFIIQEMDRDDTDLNFLADLVEFANIPSPANIWEEW
jgi:hypothetical protein